MLLAESYDIVEMSSGEPAVESESTDTKQSSHRHNVKDLCQVQHDADYNEQHPRLIVPNNQRVNSDDSGYRTSANKGHVRSADKRHVCSADKRHLNSVDSGCQSSADDRNINCADSGLVNSSECHISAGLPIKLPEFEHFLSDMPHHPSTRPITELGADTDASGADQLETERADFGEIPARFWQNMAWPSVSGTMSLQILTEDESGCCNKSERNCNSNSHRPNSLDYKSAEITDTEGRMRNNKDCSDNYHTDDSVSEFQSTRLNMTSSEILPHLTSLSDQLAAQVTNIIYNI